MILNPLSAEKSYIGSFVYTNDNGRTNGTNTTDHYDASFASMGASGIVTPDNRATLDRSVSFASVAYLEHGNASAYVSSTKRGVRFAFMTNYGRIHDLSAGRISSTGIRFARVSIDGRTAGHFASYLYDIHISTRVPPGTLVFLSLSMKNIVIYYFHVKGGGIR